MLEVSEIGGRAELESIRTEWEDLLVRSRNATIFQTPEWLLSYHRFFGGGRVATIAVRDRGKLIALAPLGIGAMYGLPLRRLGFLATGATDYLDFLLDPQAQEPALQALFSRLESSLGHWDVLDLQQVPQESPTLAFWRGRDAADGLTPELIEQEECPGMLLPATWDEFLAGLGKKTRGNIGYYERIARRDFDFSIGALGPEDVPEGMTALFHLHAQRWRKRWLPGVLTGAGRQAFHREVARLFAQKGWLRLYALRLNGDIKAVLYCFSYGGKGYYYLGGFEPSLAKYSLGTVLTAHAIRDSIEAGLKEFDFLRGNEPYKSRWTGSHKMNHRLLLRKSTPRSDLAAGVIRAERKIEHSFKEALAKRLGWS